MNQPKEIKGEGLWVGVLALTIGAFLVGFVANPFGGRSLASPESSTPQHIVIDWPDATLTPYLESPTVMATQTAVVLIATSTMADTLPWCSEVGLQTPCSLPADVQVLSPTALPLPCDIVQQTPAAYTRHCTPRDVSGSNGRIETE